MLDSLIPAAEAWTAGKDLAAVAAAAKAGAKETETMSANAGRANYVNEDVSLEPQFAICRRKEFRTQMALVEQALSLLSECVSCAAFLTLCRAVAGLQGYPGPRRHGGGWGVGGHCRRAVTRGQ